MSVAIPGYPGYTVSPDGTVVGKRGWPLKPQNCKGYRRVALYNKAGVRRFLVHRLVARAFLPTPADGLQLNHKNGDKADNRVANLEWVTPSENHHHAHRSGLKVSPKGEQHGASILTNEEVTDIKHRLAQGERVCSLSLSYGVGHKVISDIKLGKTWRHL